MVMCCCSPTAGPRWSYRLIWRIHIWLIHIWLIHIWLIHMQTRTHTHVRIHEHSCTCKAKLCIPACIPRTAMQQAINLVTLLVGVLEQPPPFLLLLCPIALNDNKRLHIKTRPHGVWLAHDPSMCHRLQGGQEEGKRIMSVQ